MAHASKRWLVAVDEPGGRVKRSRHRTTHDRLGRLSIGATIRRRDWWFVCPSCRIEQIEYRLPAGEPCRACRAAEEAQTRSGWHRWAWYAHAPAHFRRTLERQYRARVRHLMVNGRYDELPHRRRRDAAWLWW
jgi:hypothetical protein